MSLQIDLSNRVVLVTGGTKGVGAGIRDVFARTGATVVTCARSAVENPAPALAHYQCDVRKPEAAAAMIDAIVADHGSLDVLINNAGGAPFAMAADASPSFHAKITELNLLSPLLVMQQAHRVMQTQADGGAIVNVSSVSAKRPSPGTAAYGAAKAGLDSLTQSLGVEWAPKVRVNSITVGPVRTEQTDLHFGGEEGAKAVDATIPMGRMANPEDIGLVAAFLASPLAGYLTGSSIECHGGGERPAFLSAVENSTHQDS